MKHPAHPASEVLKEKFRSLHLNYSDVARLSGLPLSRIKNIMSGRAHLRVEDRDAICLALGIYPGDIVLERADLMSTSHYIDVKALSPDLVQALRIVVDTLVSQTLQITQHTVRKRKRQTTKR